MSRRFRVVVADARLPHKDREIEAMADIADLEVLVGDAPRAEIYAAVASADAMLTELTPVDTELLDHAPKLRGVVVYGVGTEKVDLNAARERGIIVAHTPDAFTWEVAEHAIALLMALTRCIPSGDRDVRERRMWRTYDDTFQPRRLRESTIGVLGYGRIGRATAASAAGLGMRLVVYDPFVPAARLTPPPGAEMRVASDLDDLLESVDALTVHVPLTAETAGMLGAPQLARMRQGALLINVSRGGIVDHGALQNALASGALGGAGLDVFETEPPNFDHPLLRESNVIVTPHIAWKSESAALRCELTAVAEVRRILLGEEPLHRVI